MGDGTVARCPMNAKGVPFVMVVCFKTVLTLATIQTKSFLQPAWGGGQWAGESNGTCSAHSSP